MTLPVPIYRMGYTYSPVFGLVMSGGLTPLTAEVQSTLDGANIDTTAIPDLPEGNSNHCMAPGPDNTLYSVGGSADNDRTTRQLKVFFPFISYL